MTSTQHLEMEIDLLEKKMTAMASDLQHKEYQYKTNMPCDAGMEDESVAILVMQRVVRARDRLDVELAEKRIPLYELQAGDAPEIESSSSPVDGSLRESTSVQRSPVRRPERKPLRRRPNRRGNYQDAFGRYLDGAVAVHLSKQPNLDRDCKQGLPVWVLAGLQPQIVSAMKPLTL